MKLSWMVGALVGGTILLVAILLDSEERLPLSVRPQPDEASLQKDRAPTLTPPPRGSTETPIQRTAPLEESDAQGEDESDSWKASKPALRESLLSVLKTHEDAVFFTWYGWTSRELTGDSALKAYRERLQDEDPESVARLINELSKDINVELDRLCSEYVSLLKDEFMRAFDEDRCLRSGGAPITEDPPGFCSMEARSEAWRAVYYLTNEDSPNLRQLQEEIFALRMKRSKVEKSVLGF